MFRTKAVEKIKTQILCSTTFRKSCRMLDNMQNYCSAGQAIDDNVAHSIAGWIPKARNTHSEYVIYIALEHCCMEKVCGQMLSS